MTDVALPLFGEPDDRGEPSVDEAFTSAYRVALDRHSWIEHVPGWLSGADAVFDELHGLEEWEQRDRWMYTRRVDEPRLTAEFPDLSGAPEVLQTMARALSAHYGVTYDRMWLNLYRDHHDSTGWHRDGASARRRDCVVPVLSLGHARRFLIRPTQGGMSSTWHPLAGDLLVMGGRCQTGWRHCVPKQGAPAGPRISVNFAVSSQFLPD
jgi:alkylated DNA repair dioxygenase AlkB